MPGNLQPLDEKFPIVGPDGRPTLYFVRWAQQRQIDIQGAVSAQQALDIAQAFVLDFLADNPLVAGSGIALTPSGNIGEDVTISALVQEILDQISTTQGTVLFRGASDWQALAPGTSGQVLQTNGAGADPSWATVSGGGGGFYRVNNPTASLFPNQFLGTGVTLNLADTAYGVYIRRTDTGAATLDRVGLATRPIPAATWTATLGVRVTAYGRAAGFIRQGLGCTNGTASIGVVYNTQNVAPAIVNNYHATLNSFTNLISSNNVYNPDIMFFRLTCDGTNIISSVSWDGGYSWAQQASRTIASTFTPTHVGLFLNTFSNTFTPELTGMAVMYWDLV